MVTEKGTQPRRTGTYIRGKDSGLREHTLLTDLWTHSWVWLELRYEIGVANSRHITKEIRTTLTWKRRQYERGRTIFFVCLSGQMILDSQEPGRRMDQVWRERGWPTMDTLAPFQREGESSISSFIPPYAASHVKNSEVSDPWDWE